MAKMIKFLTNFYDNGVVKYEAGTSYPITEETRREMLKGNAEEVDAPEPAVEDPPNEEEPLKENKRKRKAADED